MNRSEKLNSSVRVTFVLLTALILLFTVFSKTGFAAANNPAGSTISNFPAAGAGSDTIDINSGKIETLYGSGTVNSNEGEITYSQGTVKENFGSIEYLDAGHTGTNYGNIRYIRNTGSLGVNDDSGTVGINNGNKIDRNYGIITENYGTVSENYQTIVDNHGTVIMRDGTITNNFSTGTVTFETKIAGGETIPPKGAVKNNEGSILITDGTVTIECNTGNIEVKNATVTVGSNSGHITLGENGVLFCTENNPDGVITKTAVSAKADCTDNRGTIDDTTARKYRIVFIGDDGQASVIECDKEDNGVFYTEYGSTVIFTLPPEYACSSAFELPAEVPNTWGIPAYPGEEDTTFSVICHKCASNKYMYDADKHWQICTECDRKIHENAHAAGEFKPDNNDTCIEDGTETYSCAVCGYSQSRVIEGSHINSANHMHIVINPFVEPTETSNGFTEGSYCADCNAVLTAQQIIPPTTHAEPTETPNGPTEGPYGADGSEALTAQQVSPTAAHDILLPQTGDNGNIALWIAVFVISSGILTGLVVYDRNKKPDCR